MLVTFSMIGIVLLRNKSNEIHLRDSGCQVISSCSKTFPFTSMASLGMFEINALNEIKSTNVANGHEHKNLLCHMTSY